MSSEPLTDYDVRIISRLYGDIDENSIARLADEWNRQRNALFGIVNHFDSNAGVGQVPDLDCLYELAHDGLGLKRSPARRRGVNNDLLHYLGLLQIADTLADHLAETERDLALTLSELAAEREAHDVTLGIVEGLRQARERRLEADYTSDGSAPMADEWLAVPE